MKKKTYSKVDEIECTKERRANLDFDIQTHTHIQKKTVFDRENCNKGKKICFLLL